MAKLGRIQASYTDNLGNAINLGTITVRKQGATVNGTASGSGPSLVITVNNPGGIIVGDSVANTAGTTTWAVTAVTATQVTISIASAVTFNDNDRLSPVTNLPSLFKDSASGEAEVNPIQTDADGQAAAWVDGGYYDVLSSSTLTSSRLRQDVVVAAESEVSCIFDSALAVAYQRDTARALSTAGAKLDRWSNGGAEKASIDKDGKITAAGGVEATTGGIKAVAGGLTATAGGLLVGAGGATITGTLTLTGSGAASGSLTAAGLSSTASIKHKDRADLASAAALTIPAGNYFRITGTTPITSIVAASSDNARIVFLEFQTASEGAVVDNGTTLDLEKDFSPLAGSFLALIGDGTNWKELFRKDVATTPGARVEIFSHFDSEEEPLRTSLTTGNQVNVFDGEFFVAANSGGSTANLVEGSTSHYLSLNIKASINANTGISVSKNAFPMIFEARFKAGSNIAFFYAGFSDDNHLATVPIVVPANGLFLQRNGTDIYNFTNRSASTSTDGANITIVNGTWFTMKIIVDSASSIRYFIDGVLKETLTTNIPTAMIYPMVVSQNSTVFIDRLKVSAGGILADSA